MERPTPIGDIMWSAGLVNVHKNQGFTYIGVLIIVAVMMMALGAASQVWHTVMQREKEQELLFIGHQFRAAIGNYFQQSGGRFPPSLEVLLESSDLGANKVRFIRKLYLDPMTGDNKWGLVTGIDEKIMGIYSLSDEKPYKTTGFIDADADLENAEKYSDWKFVYKTNVRRRAGGGVTVNPRSVSRFR